MNSIQLVGRLTKDPELVQGQNVTYCRFCVAVPRGYGGKDKVTDFFNCTAFGKVAEAVSEYIKKGEQIAVQGRMEFTTKDKITYANVSVTNVTFISMKETVIQIQKKNLDNKKLKHQSHQQMMMTIGDFRGGMNGSIIR